MSRAPGRGATSPALDPEGPARRQFHLEAWDRYCRILEEQLACLEASEPALDRFQDLARQRDRLARMIDAMQLASPETPEAYEQMERIGRRVAECQARDREVLDRLGGLRRDHERVIKGFEERRQGRQGYVAGARLGRANDRAHIDVTS